MSEAFDLARVRHENALRLFDEFVHANVRSADAATLRGLERRFAERLQIQPSYWSQIKARSRQIGERLARQFEQLSRKPAGWMDQAHGALAPSSGTHGADVTGAASQAVPAPAIAPPPSQPQDDDERFIVGLVLTYYRRHPQRARARLLDLLGEVLTPAEPPVAKAAPASVPAPSKPGQGSAPGRPASDTKAGQSAASGRSATPPDDDHALWQRSQAGVAPLPRKR